MRIPTIKIQLLYYHPHRCFKCGRWIGLSPRKKQVICNECYKEVKFTASAKFPKDKHLYADARVYNKLRKEVIGLAGHCALCGSKENLTVHHIGGRTDIGLTCLCRDCHDKYENIIKAS